MSRAFSCRGPRRCIGALTALLAVAACDRLTDVEFPDLVQPEQLDNATGAAALYSGAQHFFAVAFNGSTGSGSAFVYNTGLMSDELRGATGGAIVPAFDTRELNPTTTTVGEVFATLSRARVTALSAVSALRTSAPTPASRVSQSWSIAAFTELFMAQMYCSGVPLTEVVEGLPTTFGTPLTSAQLFTRAAADFDSAIAAAGTDAPSLNLARVGKARALLELGQYAAAAAAVAAVPTTYAHPIAYSATVLPNLVGLLSSSRAATVANVEGANGLDFRAAGDPRVTTTFVARGPDGVTDVFTIPTLTASSSTVLTGGIEARLIEAEADLAGNNANWLTTLNTLRATAISPALPALSDPGTPSGRVDLLFRERAFWLFLTGHRQADLRRLVRQYGRAPGATFPTGTYGSGRTYTSEVNASLPVQESVRNPNFTGCVDRSA
jgi:starch-binding outer membrane protein, SusD/RagB family